MRPLPLIGAALLAGALLAPGGRAGAADPAAPTDPTYTVRDTQNIADAYGRITAPAASCRTRPTSRRWSPRPM